MEQMDFSFPLDQGKVHLFLLGWCSLEQEEDRIREDKRALKERYQDHIPLRALLTAVKIVRARQKLAEHPKEPMAPIDLACLEVLVERHAAELADAAHAFLSELDGTTCTLAVGEVAP